MQGAAVIEQTGPKAQEGFMVTVTPSNFADKTVIPSRYMGTSVGSCHDFCKYGYRDLNKKQKDYIWKICGPKSRDIKNMKRRPVSATVMKEELSSPEANELQNCSESLTQERKVSPLSKILASSTTKGMLLNASKMKPSPKVVERIKCSFQVMELSNPGKGLNVCSDSQGKSPTKSIGKRRISKDTSRAHIVSPQVCAAKVYRKEGELYKKQNVMQPRSPKRTESLKPEKKRLVVNNPDSGVKSGIGIRKGKGSQVRRPDMSNRAKNLKPCQSESMVTQLSSSLEKRTLRSTRGDTGIHRNPSSPSMSASIKIRDLRQNGKLIRQSSSRRLRIQTTPVIATHREEKDSSANRDIEAEGQVFDLSADSKIQTKRLRKHIHETHYVPPVKLKFQRGKTVDPQDHKNSPWKLVLRRGRILSEPQHTLGVTRLRSFKRNGIVDEVLKGRTSHEKIVLRHQDVVENRTIQNSFNNVIEETASKLAESRKSKVKALVVAFETVISLQSH